MYYKKTEQGFFLRLKRGEKIMESLIQFAHSQDIGSASVIGIGAVMDTCIGNYVLEKRAYDRKEFPEDAELVQLTGNLSWVDGSPFPHCHVTLGMTDYRAIAGHLFEATCAVTVELALSTYEQKITRSFDDEVGLKLLDL